MTFKKRCAKALDQSGNMTACRIFIEMLNTTNIEIITEALESLQSFKQELKNFDLSFDEVRTEIENAKNTEALKSYLLSLLNSKKLILPKVSRTSPDSTRIPSPC